MKLKITNNMMNDLVNYGFKSFNNGKLPLPIDINENGGLMDIIKSNKIALISFQADNSINEIVFYVVSINSEEQLLFENILLKTNYFVFNDDKYFFN